MEKTFLISIEDCCANYNIEMEFINSLEDHGLLAPTQVNDQRFIEQDHLQQLEKFISMHYDMDINMEGIEVINRLLDRINEMQQEIMRLKNNFSV